MIGRSFRPFPIGLALILTRLIVWAPAGLAAEEETIIPVSEVGRATAELDGASFPISYSVTPLGTLISLRPIVSRLGGDLEIGPLGQSHRLSIAGVQYIFGPDSFAVTYGDEIVSLSQPPRIGSDGLHVPFDLLDRMYGADLGFGFRWSAAEKRLEMAQRQMRLVSLAVELVNLQGVSTLVLHFDDDPRYRVEEQNGAVVVEMLGDRAALVPGQQLAPDPLVRGVHVTEERITIDIVPGARSEHYTLDSGRRLVFEIFRGKTAIALADPEPGASRDRRRKTETIVIDPGHGGRDAGTIGKDGLTEKDLALRIARSLKSTLERLYPVHVVLTRSEDAYLPLETRTAIANQHDADLFISLHLNASRGSNAHGAETYFLSLQATDESAELLARSENERAGVDAGAVDDLDLILWNLAQNRYLGQSQNLAKMIQAELNERIGITNRGVKQAPFRVLTGARMPAVLVEVGFLSNDDEAGRLATTEYQADLVEGLAEAIGRYRQTVRPATPSSPDAAVQAARADGATP